MLARYESGAERKGHSTAAEKRAPDRSAPRMPAVRVVVLDDRGRVIGRILAPTGSDLFGPGRATVYLTRLDS